MAKSALPVTFGAMTFGAQGRELVRVGDPAVQAKILDVFQSHGHNEVDTARTYGAGTSEESLGALDWQKRGLVMDTKLYPTARRPGMLDQADAMTHSASDIKKFAAKSMAALKADKISALYLHGPDRETPFEETLGAIDELYKQGLFERFGVSNYKASEVEELLKICDAKGYVRPTIYQGPYNCVQRNVEAELWPILEREKISFYAFSPLGGGVLTGAHTRDSQDQVEKGSRFDPNTPVGKMYRKRYFNDAHWSALEELQAQAKKRNITMGEIALRWLSHHSRMDRARNDNVIIGASSLAHIESNLVALEQGPLDDELVALLDKTWDEVKSSAVPYHH